MLLTIIYWQFTCSIAGNCAILDTQMRATSNGSEHYNYITITNVVI